MQLLLQTGKLKENGDTNYLILENKNDKLVFALFNSTNISGKNRKEAICISDAGFASHLQKR